MEGISPYIEKDTSCLTSNTTSMKIIHRKYNRDIL